MEELVCFATENDPLLACSMCRCLLREAVLLKCLHSCCRQCFIMAASTNSCREGVECGSCGAVTHVGSEQTNTFMDRQVKHCMSAESKACDKCNENGEHDKAALVWCPTCRHSLCDDCMAVHSLYYRQHVTQSLEELKGLGELCLQPSAIVCRIHGKPLDIVCLNCEEEKCISCWASCKGEKHEVYIVSEKLFDSYVSSLISGISSMESELLRKSAVLDKPKKILQDTKAACHRHLEDLKKRKRRVVEAVEEAYDEMVLRTKQAYDDIEAEGMVVAHAAQRIASDLSQARSYIHRLVDSKENSEMFKQQKMLRERLSVLSADLDCLSERLATATREVKMEGSLLENVDDVVRAWIGTPRTYSVPSVQQQQQSFSFGVASVSFKLPVDCWDVALTQDGRSLLLAAGQHGFIELSSSCGHQLSRWRPPKLSSSQDDRVRAVAALNDGRAAVSLQFAQLVVLLRRSEKDGNGTGRAAASTLARHGAWTEDRRLDVLPWPVWCLSAHGDVLAASESRMNEQRNMWQPGPRLQLLSLSSGQLLRAELQREYDIVSLIVAADVIVTGSYDKVDLGSGQRAAPVLDAHSLTDEVSDKQLWRHVLTSNSSSEQAEEVEEKGSEVEDEEGALELWLPGVCLDSSGCCLYAAVRSSDWSSGRVSALSLADGSELRRAALSFTSAAAAAAATQPQLLLLPVQLSLCEDGAASATPAEHQQQRSSGRRMLLLAALCWDATTDEWRTVTLHRSTSDVLQ